MALLTFLLHHLDIVASNWSSNKMCWSNLAIVLTPNLLPVQEVTRKAKQVIHWKYISFLSTTVSSLGGD